MSGKQDAEKNGTDGLSEQTQGGTAVMDRVGVRARILGGRPTGPQVETLMEAVGKGLQRGELVTYETIETLLKEKRGSNRFKTVVHRFVRAVRRQRGISLQPEPNVGYRAATVERQMLEAEAHHKKAVRAEARGLEAVAVIQEADMTAEQKVRAIEIAGSAKSILDQLRAATPRVRLVLPAVGELKK